MIRGRYTRWITLFIITGVVFLIYHSGLLIRPPEIKQVDLQREIHDKISPIAEKFIPPRPVEISKKVNYPEPVPPTWGPFDPRFTISNIIDVVVENYEHGKPYHLDQFHWGDYVDMTPYFEWGPAKCSDFDHRTGSEKADKRVRHRKPSDFCVDIDETIDEKSNLRPGYKIFDTPGRSVSQHHQVLSKSYLIHSMPPPHSVNLMVQSDMIQVQAGEDTRRQQFVHSQSGPQLTQERDVGAQIQQLRKLVGQKDHPIAYEIELSDSDFIDPSVAVIEELEAAPSLNASDQVYLAALKYQPKWVPKHFHESLLLKSIDHYILGGHYDWRFFNQLLPSQEEQVVISGLIQTWLKFCRINNIRSWLAHGSLLSWWWNALPFPWDIDVDVQMPIVDLHRLARLYNGSIIIDVGSGDRLRYGRYYLDVATSINHRTKGNGLNNIDARFIDMDTGVYIDITALAKVNGDPPKWYPKHLKEVYTCRNNHFSSLKELSPLRLTPYSGELAYVPASPDLVLEQEYRVKAIKQTSYQWYVYVEAYGIWVPQETWASYVEEIPHLVKDIRLITSSRKDFLRSTYIGIDDDQLEEKLSRMPYPIIKLPSEEDYVQFLSSHFTLLQSYLVNFPLVHLHAQEMELIHQKASTRNLLFDGKELRSDIKTIDSRMSSDLYTVRTNSESTDDMKIKLDRLDEILKRWT